MIRNLRKQRGPNILPFGGGHQAGQGGPIMQKRNSKVFKRRGNNKGVFQKLRRK